MLYGHMFRILSSAASQAVTNDLAEMGLTSAQGHILGYLARCKEPPCPRDVEEHFHLTHPTVSGLLSRMEKKEFIALQPDPDDRRCKRIYILPKGREWNGQIYRTITENEERIVSGFTEEEKKVFADLLARAVQNMGGERCCMESKEEENR